MQCRYKQRILAVFAQEQEGFSRALNAPPLSSDANPDLVRALKLEAQSALSGLQKAVDAYSTI